MAADTERPRDQEEVPDCRPSWSLWHFLPPKIRNGQVHVDRIETQTFDLLAALEAYKDVVEDDEQQEGDESTETTPLFASAATPTLPHARAPVDYAQSEPSHRTDRQHERGTVNLLGRQATHPWRVVARKARRYVHILPDLQPVVMALILAAIVLAPIWVLVGFIVETWRNE